jgi:hypothetical protein
LQSLGFMVASDGMQIWRLEQVKTSAIPVVVELGMLAEKALRNEETGRVVAVFERSFYAVLGGRWLCVGLSGLGSGPLHVLCQSRPNCWPMVGDVVTVCGSIIRIGNNPFASFDSATVWKPECVPNWTWTSLRIGLRAVDRFWNVHPAEVGLAAAGCSQLPSRISPMVSAAVPAIVALDRIIRDTLNLGAASSNDFEDFAQLVGLGPGLTPSGDDLISGALIALATLNLLSARDVVWRASYEHLDRTNDISRAHLRTAALGYGAAALHVAIHRTISGSADRIRQALANVSAIGQSSGRDSIAGALVALRAVEWHLSRTKHI